jgi:hypothetical protein
MLDPNRKIRVQTLVLEVALSYDTSITFATTKEELPLVFDEAKKVSRPFKVVVRKDLGTIIFDNKRIFKVVVDELPEVSRFNEWDEDDYLIREEEGIDE